MVPPENIGRQLVPVSQVPITSLQPLPRHHDFRSASGRPSPFHQYDVLTHSQFTIGVLPFPSVLSIPVSWLVVAYVCNVSSRVSSRVFFSHACNRVKYVTCQLEHSQQNKEVQERQYSMKCWFTLCKNQPIHRVLCSRPTDQQYCFKAGSHQSFGDHSRNFAQGKWEIPSFEGFVRNV